MTATRIRDALLLSGRDLDVLAYALHCTQRARQQQGLPPSPEVAALAALVAASPPQDTPTAPDPENEPMTTSQAAAQLGCSRRTATRLAPQLDGQLIGGRWLIPAAAVTEHLHGGFTA